MKKTLYVTLAVFALTLAALPLLALQAGTWECMGYTIVVTPDDPNDPDAAGSISITKSDEYAIVDIEGRYAKVGKKQPTTTAHVWGTIETPDGTIVLVDRAFTFRPGPQKSVWKMVVSWIESQIAS
jgi:hypothetical protein